MKFPTYTCHKVVEAATIVGIVRSVAQPNDGSLSLLVKPNLDCDETYLVQTTVPAMTASAKVGDYYVVYDGGKHTSVSQKEVFEEGYKLDVADVVKAAPAVTDEPQHWRPRPRPTPPQAGCMRADRTSARPGHAEIGEY